MFKNNQQKGFTLVQLIITVAIISILAGVVLFGEGAISRKGKAQDVRRQVDIENIAKAVELYQIDNGALPSDLAAANINTGQKVVLCSSASTLSCDGQSRACLVINDEDFIKPYFGDSLPIDPQKTSTSDTGYYITRSGDKMVFGACDTYELASIEHVALATLATYTATCGDGVVEVDEVCDDGYNESCGDSIIQNGSFCNSTCSGYQSLTEACDYGPNTGDDCSLVAGTWTIKTGKVTDTWCKIDCSELLINCVAP